MSGLFTKMIRRVFTCQFCFRSTDVMAFDDEDANKRISDKGWRKGTVTNKDGKEVMIFACRGCGRFLLDAQDKKEGKDG